MNNLHPLQSEKWGEFRKKTGVKVVNINNLQITIHALPHTNYKIGYLPKGPQINKKMLDELYKLGGKENCIFIQLEPNIEKLPGKDYKFKNLVSSAHPLFTRYTFVLDITKSEEELLKEMNQKTRYNIRVAERKGVKITEDNSDKVFGEYLKLTKETTTRQKFYAHSENYHKLMWETLRQDQNIPFNPNELSAHLFKAVYNSEVLATWILFVLGDTLYYPYGASSSNNKEVMASNLMMWEVIRFGKKLGLKKFDMWGALGPNPNPKDPWHGFNRFKEGYSGKLVEYVGSYDLIINKKLYFLFKLVNNLRWILLRFK
jgi:lipid II:glycine glycyltransferase (peptidoglycan interpeptide bridge formation enzyme)